MKNVLFIEPFCPYPLVSGGHQAIYNGIAAMMDVANVYVVYAHTSWKDYSEAGRLELEKRFPFVHVLHYGLAEKSSGQFWFKLKRRIRRTWGKWMGKIRKPKVDINDYRSWGFEPQPDNYAQYINQLIEQYHIDVVQVEMCFQLSMVLDLPKHVKKIFVHHELRYVREELRLANIEVPLSFRHEVTIHKFEEIGLLNMYDEIVVLSETDKQKLIADGVTTPILTSFAVVNTEKPSEDISGKWKYVLSFIGPESHDPNYDGVMWFLENCWNELRAKNADYKLRIIGKWSADTCDIIRSQYPNVEFAGFVENLSDALSGTVMIVPIRVGSGIRMKILEAGAIGVPVVSTRVGAEGLPVEDGENILLADSSESFVGAVLKMENEVMRVALAKQLQATIQKKYSVAALRENRRCLYV